MSIRTYADRDIQSTLISQERLQARVREMGAEITRKFRNEPPIMVCILKGAFVFFADLIRCVDLPVRIDFMAASSYGGGTESSGEVHVVKDLPMDITGRNIMLVEDIIDSGRTLAYLKRLLESRNAKKVYITTLLDKPSRRAPEININVDYKGFEVPDQFVIGWGMDYDQRYRNLPYIGVITGLEEE